MEKLEIVRFTKTTGNCTFRIGMTGNVCQNRPVWHVLLGPTEILGITGPYICSIHRKEAIKMHKELLVEINQENKLSEADGQMKNAEWLSHQDAEVRYILVRNGHAVTDIEDISEDWQARLFVQGFVAGLADTVDLMEEHVMLVKVQHTVEQIDW